MQSGHGDTLEEQYAIRFCFKLGKKCHRNVWNASDCFWSILNDYLTKIGIKTVHHRPYSPDLPSSDFCLSPKLRGCRYETIEEMKEAVMKVIDMVTQEDFDRALQKLLAWYNKCIAARGDYFEGDFGTLAQLEFHVCIPGRVSIKVPIQKKSGNLFNDPRIYIYIYIEIDR